MSEALFRYYDEERLQFRDSAKSFFKLHQDAASQLLLRDDGRFEDPHVDQLVWAFSLIAARLRLKIDDEFSEISHGLLDLLCPHLAAPFPASGIVQLEPKPSTAGGGQPTFQAGCYLKTDSGGTPYVFRTCAEVSLAHVQVAEATLGRRPASYPVPEGVRSDYVLRMRMTVPRAGLMPKSLRFFVNIPQLSLSASMFEFLISKCKGVRAIGRTSSSEKCCRSVVQLHAAGRAMEEGLLCRPGTSLLNAPMPPKMLPIHSLLADFAARPEKFLFVEFSGWTDGDLINDGKELEVALYFDQERPDLQSYVNPETLLLRCVPIVNLFEQKAQPIERMDHAKLSYRVAPSEIPREHFEVFSIDRVVGEGTGDAQATEVKRLFSPHRFGERPGEVFWWATRTLLAREAATKRHGRTSEVDIQFVNAAHEPLDRSDWTVNMDLTCTNAMSEPDQQVSTTTKLIPAPERSGQPDAFASIVAGARFVSGSNPRLTPQSPPMLGKESAWRLISLLSLPHFSFGDPSQAASLLRQLLDVQHHGRGVNGGTKSSSITSLRVERLIAPKIELGDELVMRPGWLIQLSMSSTPSDTGLRFLLATVLDEVFAMLSPLNYVVQTELWDSSSASRSAASEGWLHAFPPRHGRMALL